MFASTFKKLFGRVILPFFFSRRFFCGVQSLLEFRSRAIYTPFSLSFFRSPLCLIKPKKGVRSCTARKQNERNCVSNLLLSLLLTLRFSNGSMEKQKLSSRSSKKCNKVFVVLTCPCFSIQSRSCIQTGREEKGGQKRSKCASPLSLLDEGRQTAERRRRNKEGIIYCPAAFALYSFITDL